LAVRLPRLAMRPMHCDEANQAVRAGVLLETGQYRYDPQEHHGPSLYWLALPALWLSGTPDLAHAEEVTFRLVPVLFGVGLILLLPLVADGLGRGPACVAALLTAISPAMVFYSRYYIQETLLVFFTMAAIAAGWRWYRSRSLWWAVAAGVAFGLMHATKETWVLAAAAMAVAWVLTAVGSEGFRIVAKTIVAFRSAKERGFRGAKGDNATQRILRRAVPFLLAGLAAAFVAIAFYSSFGRNWQGPLDSILAYATYARRGTEAGWHSHPWYYYLELLVAYRPQRGFFWTEGLIVGLAVVGGLSSLSLWARAGVRAWVRANQETASLSLWARAVARANQETAFSGTPSHPLPEGEGNEQVLFRRFLFFYTLTLLVLYSALSYKTPWCLLGFLHGMILLAGVGAWIILRELPGRPLRAVAGLLLACGVVHLGWESYALNTRFAWDERNPYVYAHTVGDTLSLAALAERLAEVSPEGHEMWIDVVTPENFWPLPWYFRRFNANHVGYWPDAADWVRDSKQLPPASVIVLTADVEDPVDAALRVPYNQQTVKGLRPDVKLLVYVRDDLWQKFLAAGGMSGK
jgi:uncharacterized protein (TIGR03663 family)